MENKTISVWLKLEDGDSKGKIILQKRSDRNKSFPFICQATWAGKVENKETIEQAVGRECKEELGNEFSSVFDFSSLKEIKENIFSVKEEKWLCFNFFGKVDSDILKLVNLHNESLSEFEYVDDKSKIFPISSGQDPKNNVVLFDDQYKILKDILNNGY